MPFHSWSAPHQDPCCEHKLEFIGSPHPCTSTCILLHLACAPLSDDFSLAQIDFHQQRKQAFFILCAIPLSNVTGCVCVYPQLAEQHPCVVASFGIVLSHKMAVTAELLQLCRAALGTGRSFEATEKLIRELHMEQFWRRRLAYTSSILSWRKLKQVLQPAAFGDFGDATRYAGKTPRAQYLVSKANPPQIQYRCCYFSFGQTSPNNPTLFRFFQ